VSNAGVGKGFGPLSRPKIGPDKTPEVRLRMIIGMGGQVLMRCGRDTWCALRAVGGSGSTWELVMDLLRVRRARRSRRPVALS
jgi:hypothetical protein